MDDPHRTTPQLFPTATGWSIFGPLRTIPPPPPPAYVYQAGTTLKQFTVFQELPPEIRYEIWRFAMPARMIELVDYTNRGDNPVPRAPKAPTIFFACREARNEVMMVCTPVRGIDGIGVTLIDLQKDIICIRNSRTRGIKRLEPLRTGALNAISRIAVSPNVVSEPWFAVRGFYKHKFPGLSDILVATNDPGDGTDEEEREITGFEEYTEVKEGTLSRFEDWGTSDKRELEEAAWKAKHPGVLFPNVTMGRFILGKRYHSRAPAQTPWRPNYRKFFE